MASLSLRRAEPGAGRRRSGRRPADRRRRTAATPTPSYAAPHTARPGDAGDRAPDPRDPVEVADGVLRQRAAPAGDPGSPAAGPRSPDRVAELGDRRAGPARRRRAAAPRSPRAARTRPAATGTASGTGPLADPGPLAARPGGRLDRPALDRRHQEPGAGRPRRNTASAGTASVTPARRWRTRSGAARRRPPARTASSSRAAGAAGTASTHGVGLDLSSGARSAPADDQPPARLRYGASAAHGARTCAPRRRDASATAAGSRPTPPTTPAKTGTGGSSRTARRRLRGGGRQQRATARGERGHLRRRGAAATAGRRGRRRPRRAAARAAGRPPRRPSRRPTSRPTATSPSGASHRRAGSDPVQRGPGQPPAPSSTPAAGQRPRGRSGRPSTVGGSARSRPAAPHRGCRRGRRVAQVVAEADRADQVDRLRPAVQHRLGAGVDAQPGELGLGELAADASAPTRARSLAGRGAAARSRCAAARPAMPAPTTTQCRWAPWADRSRAPAHPPGTAGHGNRSGAGPRPSEHADRPTGHPLRGRVGPGRRHRDGGRQPSCSSHSSSR